MIEVRQTEVFRAWWLGLRDRRAQRKIADRIARIQGGLLGDLKQFDGLTEFRIDHGPGYRCMRCGGAMCWSSCYAVAINRLRIVILARPGR